MTKTEFLLSFSDFWMEKISELSKRAKEARERGDFAESTACISEANGISTVLTDLLKKRGDIN